ncbi:MAG: class I SAM-dependent methyltransferase [Deltaproteobacteria bacterium]|nr:class I SAM-dependent methyltransferase [Deltaproteobacteria bacterium]
MAAANDAGIHYDQLGALYDGEYDSESQDVAFYQALAARSGGPILELACGSGRLLAHLADPDYGLVVGLDSSGVQLERARARLGRHPKAGPMLEAERLRLVQGDMCEFDLPAGPGYSLAIVALNSFLHLLDARDQSACLGCIVRHLAPGGLLAMEVFNPEVKDRHPGVRGLEVVGDFRHPETGHRVQHLTTVHSDPAAQRRRYLNLYDEIASDGTVRRTVHEFWLRYIYRFEMERMLEAAGLELEAVYGGYEFEPYTGREEEMLFVAVKPGERAAAPVR